MNNEEEQVDIIKAIRGLIRKSKTNTEFICTNASIKNGFLIKYKKHSKLISNIIMKLKDSNITYELKLKSYDDGDNNGLFIPVNKLYDYDNEFYYDIDIPGGRGTHIRNIDLYQYWKWEVEAQTLYYR